MDFFKELLESYSRRHGRSLRLLESEAKAIPQERIEQLGIIKGVFDKFVSAQVDTTQTGQGTNKDITVKRTKQGVNFDNGSMQGFPNGVTIKKPDDFKQSNINQRQSKIYPLIRAWFPGEVELSKEQKVSAAAGAGTMAGETIATEGNFSNDEEGRAARQAAASIFQDISIGLESALNKLGLGEKYGKLKSYFFGKRQESLELRLANSDRYLEYDEETGAYFFNQALLDDSQIIGIGEVLKNMIDSVNAEECPKGPKSFTDNIKKTKRGEIFIAPYSEASMGEALVFSDDKGVLKDIIGKAFELCGEEKIPQVEIITDDVGGGSDNNTLGTGMEEFRKLAVLYLQAKALQDQGLEVPDDLRQEIGYETRKLREKMAKLSDSVRRAFIHSSRAGVSPEDAETIAALQELLTGEDGDLFMAMLRNSIQDIKARNPGLITTAGQETRFGNRQDVRELYDIDKVKKSLADSGLDPDNFEVVSLDELLAAGHITEREAKAAIASGLVKDRSEKLAVCKVSMKVYKNLKHITLGAGWNRSYQDMMGEGRTEGPHAQLIDTMLDDMEVPEEEKDQAWDDMQAYHQEMQDMAESVLGIPSETVVTADGKKINTRSGKTYCDAIEKALTDNESFQGLTTGQKNRIRELIKELNSKSGESYSTDALYSRLQQEVNVMLQHQKCERDLQSSDPKVRKSAERWLASKLYHSGGSNDPKLVENARGWQSGDSITYRRNDILRKIVRGEGGWRVNTEESDFESGNIVYSGDPVDGEIPKIGMRTTPSASRPKKGEKVSSVNTITTTSANNPAMRSEERKPVEPEIQTNQTIIRALGTLHEALRIVHKKIRIIDLD